MAGGSSTSTSTILSTPPRPSQSSTKPATGGGGQNNFSPLSKADIVKQRQEAKPQQQAQHTATISLTVKNTNKILKEIGFRRAKLRNVYKKCNNAIKILNEFKDTTWPQRNDPPVKKHTQSDDDVTKHINGNINGDSNNTNNNDTETITTDVETETIVSESHYQDDVDDDHNDANVNDNTINNSCKSFESVEMDDSNHNNKNNDESSEEDEDDAKDNGDGDSGHLHANIDVVPSGDLEGEMKEHAKKALTNTINTNTTTITTTVMDDHRETSGSVGVDGLTNEQMHPAIKTALSCYCSVIENESSTPKMVEIALECIGLLISTRYVIGTTITTQQQQQKQQTSSSSSRKNNDISNENKSNNADNSNNNNNNADDEGSHDNKQSEILYLINCICERADHISETVQSAMAKALLALMTSPVVGVYEAGMLKAVRTVFHIFLVTKYDSVKQCSRSVLLDMLRSVFSRMEAYDAMAGEDDLSDSVVTEEQSLGPSMSRELQNTIFASRFHTDSYLLFRALCKLSAKLLPEDVNENGTVASSRKNIFSSNASVVDPMATNTKILSLRLILSVFENCGPAFRHGEKFIYAVQNFLCVSLVKNSMSNNPHVAHLSLKVFLLLVYKFKQHLKAEIEVFVAKVFLPTLQSPNTPEERKSLVLEALRALCADPVILTQIFLNYDCDFEAMDLYKTIVQHLTSLSVKNQHNPISTSTTSEDFNVSLGALEVLVVTLQAFLKALKLPGGDDNFDEERSKLRGTFQLDVGLAAKSEADLSNNSDTFKEEMLVSSKDIESMENNSSNGVAGKIVDAFDKKRIAQRNFETGSIKFRLSAKQGLLFFVQHGFIRLDAREIAAFFLINKEKLDKTQMGEIFGREPEASFVKGEGVDPEKGGVGFYIRVLHHYVDALDFTGVKFDDAIRLFLSGFRLPGESQKVDRIMEKFAERYTLQNEKVFPSADTAFILSFAVIMLQTDLHNPNIKPEKKMTAESFINMNKGISVDGGDLDKQFLMNIFNSIKERPFTLKEDEDARESQKKSKEKIDIETFFGPNAKDKRRERFNKERAELVEASEQLFKKQKVQVSTPTHLTESVCPADVVKPMFDITWGPLIGALSQILEKANDDSSIKLCLNGFVYAVRIAAHCEMELAKDTFVTSLAKFTALGSADEMKPSNIESIRTLLSISIMDGEKLGESWRPILQCISQLGRLQFFASGVDSDDAFLESNGLHDKAKSTFNNEKLQQRKDSLNSKDSTLKTAMSRETEEFNSRAVLEAINEVLIEKVFSFSTKLSDNAILQFIDSLVIVSESEIEGTSKKNISGVGRATSSARIFSLQKLVEVADYNMKIRSRRSWAKIWDLMAGHLVTIGCHYNANVSMFAIDSLRQLTFKFLEKPELADFNFQRLFLQPFLSIMENAGTLEDTRELILQCVDNSIRSMSHNIRSGWKIFFSILALTAEDPSEKISTAGLAILQRLLDDHMDQLCNSIIDLPEEKKTDREISVSEVKARNTCVEDFIGLCRASMAFIESKKNHSGSISMRALCHASVYADYIAEGKICPPLAGIQCIDKSAFGYSYNGLSVEDATEMVLWRPILDGLATGICSTVSIGNSEGVGCILQRGSVITLRAILLRHGHRFSASQWGVIMDCVILPAMQIAIETDTSSVTKIISESPIVSNLDFFSEPLSLPPSDTNEGLLKFAEATHRLNRAYGASELLVEASFADLRHGGDGDLTKAYTLVEKDVLEEAGNYDEPFPDSWVATTGPIALGMLTDIFCMIVMRYKVVDSRKMWPIVMGQMQQWAVGCPLTIGNTNVAWSPCEALVRIGCKEISRLSETLIALLPRMGTTDVQIWLNVLCKNLADTLSYSIDLEGKLHDEFVRLADPEASNHFFKESNGINEENNIEKENIVVFDAQSNDASKKPVSNRITTPYGSGEIVFYRVDEYPSASVEIDVRVVQLDFGGTLYEPKQLYDIRDTSGIESSHAPQSIGSEIIINQNEAAIVQDSTNVLPEYNRMEQLITPLRVRCTASFCLQKTFLDFLELFATNCGKVEVSALLNALEQSRIVASKASIDKDLSASFEQAILVEWGDKVEELNKSFSSDGGVGHLRRSEMFFLTQEASADNILIHFLALLYCPKGDGQGNRWDTVSFSGPLLGERITDVLQKFVISEKEYGQKIDPNVWRVASESGGTFAVPCTSFAFVVVNILNTMMKFTDAQFDEQKNKVFPILCSLITIQSSEIRDLVAAVMRRKVSVLLGIED